MPGTQDCAWHGTQVLGPVCCRGHHQDVGGITPGSMPPNSRSLTEEGAAIIAFKLVRGGKFQVGLGLTTSQSFGCLLSVSSSHLGSVPG